MAHIGIIFVDHVGVILGMLSPARRSHEKLSSWSGTDLGLRACIWGGVLYHIDPFRPSLNIPRPSYEVCPQYVRYLLVNMSASMS